MSMTPYQLRVLLHYYVSPSPCLASGTKIFSDTIKAWVIDGTLLKTDEKLVYDLSDGAKAWIKLILRTPRPRRVYVDQNDEVIEL